MGSRARPGNTCESVIGSLRSELACKCSLTANVYAKVVAAALLKTRTVETIPEMEVVSNIAIIVCRYLWVWYFENFMSWLTGAFLFLMNVRIESKLCKTWHMCEWYWQPYQCSVPRITPVVECGAGGGPAAMPPTKNQCKLYTKALRSRARSCRRLSPACP